MGGGSTKYKFPERSYATERTSVNFVLVKILQKILQLSVIVDNSSSFIFTKKKIILQFLQK